MIILITCVVVDLMMDLGVLLLGEDQKLFTILQEIRGKENLDQVIGLDGVNHQGDL